MSRKGAWGVTGGRCRSILSIAWRPPCVSLERAQLAEPQVGNRTPDPVAGLPSA
jgi:hypothetical protein